MSLKKTLSYVSICSKKRHPTLSYTRIYKNILYIEKKKMFVYLTDFISLIVIVYKYI